MPLPLPVAHAARCLRVLLLAAGPCTIVGAQSTWVVDDDGGPGVDFTDIQSALDAATPGDLVDVRTGAYPSFVARKGVSILAPEPDPSGFAYEVQVAGISGAQLVPAGETLVVYGVSFTEFDTLNCQGVVVLDSCRLGTARVEYSEDVRYQSCQVYPGSEPPLNVDSSRLTLDRTEVHGFSVQLFGDGGPAMQMAGDCTLVASRSRIEGGDGSPAPFGGCIGAGGSGIILRGTGREEIHLIDSVVEVGRGSGCSPSGAIYGCSGNTHVFETGIPAPVVPCGGAVQSVPVRPLLTLESAAIPGATPSLMIRSMPGAELSLLAGAAPLSPPGATGIPLSTLGDRVVRLGVAPTGSLSKGIALPATIRRGAVLHLQAFAKDPAGGQYLSAPIALIVR